ncbi:hypothetical protein K1719_032153 [Acacia pycnantha]|nr:hypothetical protein K1719_032153 [Acacia pycnantha]
MLVYSVWSLDWLELFIVKFEDEREKTGSRRRKKWICTLVLGHSLFKLNENLAMKNSRISLYTWLCGAPLRPCSDSIGILGSKGTWKLTSAVLLCAGLLIFLIAALAFGIAYFRRGVKSQWKMISFVGLPQFKANDV